jgi:virginiamycin B lyase
VSQLARITTSGVITEFPPIPVASSGLQGITTGPDGNLWAVEPFGNNIAKFTTSGALIEYPIPTPGNTYDIATGPDGNLWFTETTNGQIAKITLSGVVTEYPLPDPLSSPYGITAGPDGNLWFTEGATSNIGKITPGGIITEYQVPTANGTQADITPGPDNTLWFTELGGNNIGRVGEPMAPLPNSSGSNTVASSATPAAPDAGYGVPGNDDPLALIIAASFVFAAGLGLSRYKQAVKV